MIEVIMVKPIQRRKAPGYQKF